MGELSKERVKVIADMVRIAISDEEAEMYAEQLSKALDSVNVINQLNTDDVEPTTHGGLALENVLRRDKAIQSITQEDALKNAPEKQDGHFKVPSIME